MKQTQYLTRTCLPLLTGFIFLSCYTQLAVIKRVIVKNHPVYTQPEAYVPNEDLYDTLETVYEPAPSIVHEYHYWFSEPSCYWFGYDPWVRGPGFNFSFNYRCGDPFWDPWYYPTYRPYGWRPYYADWYWYDPYLWDPYYGYGYYAGYYPGYWHSYRGGYYDGSWDYPPKKKRDWERRGADLSDGMISRSGGSAGSQLIQNVNGPGNTVVPIGRSAAATRTVKRNDQTPEKPARRNSPTEATRERDNNRKQESRTISISKRGDKSVKKSTTRSARKQNDNQSRTSKRNSVKQKDRSQSSFKSIVSNTVKRLAASSSKAKHKSKSRTTKSGRSKPSKKRTSNRR